MSSLCQWNDYGAEGGAIKKPFIGILFSLQKICVTESSIAPKRQSIIHGNSFSNQRNYERKWRDEQKVRIFPCLPVGRFVYCNDLPGLTIPV